MRSAKDTLYMESWMSSSDPCEKKLFELESHSGKALGWRTAFIPFRREAIRRPSIHHRLESGIVLLPVSVLEYLRVLCRRSGGDGAATYLPPFRACSQQDYSNRKCLHFNAVCCPSSSRIRDTGENGRYCHVGWDDDSDSMATLPASLPVGRADLD